MEAYFTINSIVGELTSRPLKSSTTSNSNLHSPIDTSMNVEIVAES